MQSKESKFYEIPEFSILFIGPNRKLGNLGNFHVFIIKPDHKVIFFVPQVFFWFLDLAFHILLKVEAK